MEKGTLINPVCVMRKALKFASRDATRPILCAIHLHECGEVVSTDSYRLFVEQQAWDGPSMTIDYATAYDIGKCKLKGNETAEFELKDGKLTVTMGDGTVIDGAIADGKYPEYKKLFDGLKTTTTAYLVPQRALPIIKEHAKAKDNVRLIANERDLHIVGTAERESAAKFDKACSGEDVEIGFNSKFLADTLGIFKDYAEIRVASPIKPAIVTDGKHVGVLVMPVRLDSAKPVKQKPKPLKADPSEVIEALYNQALDRAAASDGSRVQGGNASERERSLVWNLSKTGQLKQDMDGDFTRYELDGKFLCCIERRWSQRKIHLCYPELKPKLHRDDVVTARRMERAAREKAGAEVKATVNDMGDGVTAIVMEPRKENGMKKAPKSKEPEIATEVGSLKGERVCITGTLSGMTRSEAFTRLKLKGGIPCERFTSKVSLCVIAENSGKCKREKLDKALAKGQKVKVVSGTAFVAALMKDEPIGKEKPVAKQPKKEEPKKMATEVSLETMRKWCGERANVVATQKREGCPIWVEGETKPYQDELKELGFRWAPKRKGWYFGEKERKAVANR